MCVQVLSYSTVDKQNSTSFHMSIYGKMSTYMGTDIIINITLMCSIPWDLGGGGGGEGRGGEKREGEEIMLNFSPYRTP